MAMYPDQISADRRTALLKLICLTGSISSTSLWADERKLQLITEEWAPYNFIEDGVLKGFSVEVLQSILRKLNIEIPIEMYPSMRVRALLSNAPGTVMVTMLRTPEREGKYKWIGPLGEGEIYFYKRRGSPLQISTLNDAKAVSLIACRHGGLVLDSLKSAGFINLDPTSTNGESVYRKLLLDRCDLAISDTPLGVIYLLKTMSQPMNALVQTPLKLIGAPLYIACSTDISDVEIARWQRALDEMKASGHFAEIQKMYH